MNENLPQNSKINIGSLNGYEHIIVPYGNAGIMRFFIGAFLLFWLGGWSMGFMIAIKGISSGKGGAFLIFWLGGWSLGGIFVLYFLYRLFRKSAPFQLVLNKPNLSIDTGIPPFKMNFTMTNQKDYWKTMFPKRKKIEFTYDEIKSLKLRETEAGNRLTIDKGSDRIDIASSATEIEKEWLYKYLESNYS